MPTLVACFTLLACTGKFVYNANSITLNPDRNERDRGFELGVLRRRDSDFLVMAVRLIIMRIRFRASDFGLSKTKITRAKSKQASCADMVLGSFVFLLV